MSAEAGTGADALVETRLRNLMGVWLLNSTADEMLSKGLRFLAIEMDTRLTALETEQAAMWDDYGKMVKQQARLSAIDATEPSTEKNTTPNSASTCGDTGSVTDEMIGVYVAMQAKKVRPTKSESRLRRKFSEGREGDNELREWLHDKSHSKTDTHIQSQANYRKRQKEKT